MNEQHVAGALTSTPGLGLARRAGWANKMTWKSKSCSEMTLTFTQWTELIILHIPFIANKSQSPLLVRCTLEVQGGWRSKKVALEPKTLGWFHLSFPCLVSERGA